MKMHGDLSCPWIGKLEELLYLGGNNMGVIHLRYSCLIDKLNLFSEP